MLGKTLGHYRILDRLGAGGMGVVWLAEDLQLGRKVALKMLRAELSESDEKRARFEREARAVAALNHPNIVTLHSIEEGDGVRFLTMEYVDGRRLDHLIPERGMAALELLRIGAAIADALGAAHEIGIVHRDLKPGNILLTRDGRVKVLDFGLARTLSEVPMLSGRPRDTSLTQEGVAMGTLNYMSPEQLQGKGIDHRTDLFSLGVVLFEMATGALPFSGDSAALVISSVLRDPAPRIDERGSKLSPQLVDLIDALLAKLPENRPASAYEVRDRLLAASRVFVAETEGVPTPPRGRKSSTISAPRPTRQRPWLVAGGALLLVAIVAVGLAMRGRSAGRSTPGPGGGGALEPAIAVLPLANFSGDPDYFVDGMTDGLIGALARIDGLRVVSRQSTMHYKSSTKRLPEIAAELKVDYVVEGSLRRRTGELTLQTQLFRPDPEEQIWSDAFARREADVLALHADVARAVAAALRVELSPTDREDFASQRPVAPAVYEAYLRGRHLVEQGRPETVRKARDYFEEALRIDPSFAPAHAGLADVYGWLAYLFEEPAANSARQEKAARRAIELDPTLAEPHALLGDNYRYFHWDWKRAEEEYQRAVALNASNAAARHAFWGHLASLGRLEEARREIEIARRLDPLSAATEIHLGFQNIFEGRPAEAERSFRRALELDPASPIAHSGLWLVYDLAERDPERGAALRRLLVGFEFGDVVETIEREGEVASYRAFAQRAAELLEARSRTQRVSISVGAALFASAGDLDSAERWLERAYAEREPDLVWLGREPTWRRLWPRPKIRGILAAMRIPAPPN